MMTALEKAVSEDDIAGSTSLDIVALDVLNRCGVILRLVDVDV